MIARCSATETDQNHQKGLRPCDLRHRRALHRAEGQLLRRGVPGRLHPPDAGRARLRARRAALHRSGRVHRLRRLRRGLPGRRLLRRGPAPREWAKYTEINATYFEAARPPGSHCAGCGTAARLRAALVRSASAAVDDPGVPGDEAPARRRRGASSQRGPIPGVVGVSPAQPATPRRSAGVGTTVTTSASVSPISTVELSGWGRRGQHSYPARRRRSVAPG